LVKHLGHLTRNQLGYDVVQIHLSSQCDVLLGQSIGIHKLGNTLLDNFSILVELHHLVANANGAPVERLLRNGNAH